MSPADRIYETNWLGISHERELQQSYDGNQCENRPRAESRKRSASVIQLFSVTSWGRRGSPVDERFYLDPTPIVFGPFPQGGFLGFFKGAGTMEIGAEQELSSTETPPPLPDVPKNNMTSVILPKKLPKGRPSILLADCFYGGSRPRPDAVPFRRIFRESFPRDFSPPFPPERPLRTEITRKTCSK